MTKKDNFVETCNKAGFKLPILEHDFFMTRNSVVCVGSRVRISLLLSDEIFEVNDTIELCYSRYAKKVECYFASTARIVWQKIMKKM